MTIRAPFLALIAFSGFAVLAQADDHDKGEMDDRMTVAGLVEYSDQHTTLETALAEAGLTEALNGSGPYTVFAPTDAAFDALPEGTVESLLDPENHMKLKGILQYHVTRGQKTVSTLLAMEAIGTDEPSMTMLNGESVTVLEDDGSIYLEDEGGNRVKVIKTDLKGSNGFVHVIDGVLMP